MRKSRGPSKRLVRCYLKVLGAQQHARRCLEGLRCGPSLCITKTCSKRIIFDAIPYWLWKAKWSVLFPIWHPEPTAAQLIQMISFVQVQKDSGPMPPRCSEWEVSTSFSIILGQGCPDAKKIRVEYLQFWLMLDPRLPRRYCLETSGRDPVSN